MKLLGLVALMVMGACAEDQPKLVECDHPSTHTDGSQIRCEDQCHNHASVQDPISASTGSCTVHLSGGDATCESYEVDDGRHGCCFPDSFYLVDDSHGTTPVGDNGYFYKFFECEQ